MVTDTGTGEYTFAFGAGDFTVIMGLETVTRTLRWVIVPVAVRASTMTVCCPGTIARLVFNVLPLVW